MSVPVPQGIDPVLTDFLSSIPTVELKAVDRFDPAELPAVFFVATDLPEAVSCVQAIDVDTGTPAATLVAWKRSEDPDQPGVRVTALGGLSSGTRYSLVLRIEASRQRPGIVTSNPTLGEAPA
jgi:hypothetical protein